MFNLDFYLHGRWRGLNRRPPDYQADLAPDLAAPLILILGENLINPNVAFTGL